MGSLPRYRLVITGDDYGVLSALLSVAERLPSCSTEWLVLADEDKAPRRRVARDIQLDSGGVLARGTEVAVFTEVEDAVGIQWSDRDGSHAMAVAAADLEPAKPPAPPADPSNHS